MQARVTLTLPKPLLAQVDALARRRGLSRSALVRASLETIVRAEQERETLTRARQLYAEIEAEDRTLAAAYLPLAAETIPPYREEGVE